MSHKDFEGFLIMIFQDFRLVSHWISKLLSTSRTIHSQMNDTTYSHILDNSKKNRLFKRNNVPPGDIPNKYEKGSVRNVNTIL